MYLMIVEKTVARHGKNMLLQFLHFRHPWRSDAVRERTTTMDGGSAGFVWNAILPGMY